MKKAKKSVTMENFQALEFSELAYELVKRVSTWFARVETHQLRLDTQTQAGQDGITNAELTRRLAPLIDRLAIVEERIDINSPPHVDGLYKELLEIRERLVNLERRRASVSQRRTKAKKPSHAKKQRKRRRRHEH